MQARERERERERHTHTHTHTHTARERVGGGRDAAPAIAEKDPHWGVGGVTAPEVEVDRRVEARAAGAA
eukprot:COSAG03_NODE_20530_length_317_cov_1.720183_1_plen_68_part_10